MRAPTTLVAAVVCSLLGCAPDGTPAGATDFVVRDSAGVEIVESVRPTWSDAEAWRLSEEPLFVIHASDGGEEKQLLDPGSIDVDSGGRILIADGRAAGWDAVLVYDSLGRFEAEVGGPGRGPGEFGQLWWASRYRGDSIAAFDMSDHRVAVFDPDGLFIREVPTPLLPVPPPERGTVAHAAGVDAVYGDGYFLAYPFGRLDTSGGPGPAWMRHLLLRVAPDGESWDTLGTFEVSRAYWTGTAQEQEWFAPVALSVVSEDRLYFGKGETFEIGRYDAEGRLTRIIRRTYESRAVTEALRGQLRRWYLDRMRSSPEVDDQMIEFLGRRFDGGRFARTLPPYSGMLVDPDGNLWVEEFRWPTRDDRSPVTGPARWSVFGPEGFWLGNVETPPGFILRKVTEGRALGLVIDEMDVKEVYVYGLEKQGG